MNFRSTGSRNDPVYNWYTCLCKSVHLLVSWFIFPFVFWKFFCVYLSQNEDMFLGQDLKCSLVFTLKYVVTHCHFGTYMWTYKASLLGFTSYAVRANPEASFTFHSFLSSHKFKEEDRGHERGLWRTNTTLPLWDLWQVIFFESPLSYL